MAFGFFRKKETQSGGSLDPDDILEQLHELTGKDTRAKELPGWALLFRSPYKSYSPATSWLGGVPRAARTFRWPSGSNGRPLFFVAQIDLAALKTHPHSGDGAPGLPDEGALLVFIGEGYSIHVLDRSDVEKGAPLKPPILAPSVSSFGFWGKGKSFNAWAVDPAPFVSRSGEIRPTDMPDPFVSTRDWVTNWDLAALDAARLIEAMERDLEDGRRFVADRNRQLRNGETLTMPDHVEKRLRHHETMEDHAPGLLDELRSWLDRASAGRPEDPVDRAALEALAARREQLMSLMHYNCLTRRLLPGNAELVWRDIVGRMPEFERNQDFSRIPPAYRSLAEAKITSWRGHRLFGLEPDFPNNWEDLRGQDPFISIAADPLLGTETEHDYGFSIWLDREAMTRGNHKDGQLIHHCAV